MSASEKDRLRHPLRQSRLSEGWTQKEVADRIGVGQLEVGRWERGEAFPQSLYRERLCKLFAKTEDELGLQRNNSREADFPQDTSFPFNEMPSTLDDLYGRKRERSRLIERTRRKAATSIVGPRRIGKTWLVQYLSLAAPQQLGPQFRLGYLDASLPIEPTVVGFTRAAMQQMGISIPDALRGLTDLYYGIQTMPQGSIPVLCIDKFETLVNRGTEFTESFYQGLRSMAQVSALVLIVITRKPLFEVFESSRREQTSLLSEDMTSPFSIIFEQITLRPFNHEEARQFIEKKGKAAGFSKEELAYFWIYAREGEHSWHPALLQGIGKILQEDRERYNMKEMQYKEYFEQRFQEIQKGLGRP